METKQPRLDSSASAIAADTGTMLAKLEEMAPMKDDIPTREQANQNLQEEQANIARRKALDPRAVAEARRLAKHEEDKARAITLDARVNTIRLAINAIRGPMRPFGTISPEVDGMLNCAVSDLDADLVVEMKRSGLDGAERVIVEHETKVVPELRECAIATQNEFMKRVGAERQREAAKKTKEAVGKLTPEQGLTLLTAAGVRLRLGEKGELEVSGAPLDETAREVLKQHRPAIIATLKERDRWRKV